MVIALYQPDIPPNAGTILRLGACLGIPVHIIGPAGFDASERGFRRAGLDYLEHATLVTHVSHAAFEEWRRTEGRRAVLLTTKAAASYLHFAFQPNDILLAGRETTGVPEEVHQSADARIKVPMRAGLRSLNVAVSVAMVLGEALRQTGGFPRG
jgi:tRNA (cytidine/uridine-2'-O-)-methyltransferase